MPGQHVFENHCSGNKTQQGSQNSRTPGQQALKLISRFFGSSVEKEVEDARVKAIKLMEEARSILERDDSEFISFVMKAFFNDDSSGKRKAWIRDLHKVLSAARVRAG
jgi:hypothetical protein